MIEKLRGLQPTGISFRHHRNICSHQPPLQLSRLAGTVSVKDLKVSQEQQRGVTGGSRVQERPDAHTHTSSHTRIPGCNQTLQRKSQIMDSHNEKWSQMTLTGNFFCFSGTLRAISPSNQTHSSSSADACAGAAFKGSDIYNFGGVFMYQM